MSILFDTLDVILSFSNVSRSKILTKNLQEDQTQKDMEKLIGVTHPLLANAEDKSDNLYEV